MVKLQKWISVIGLEIHAQISSKSKLFSSAGNKFFAAPNSIVSYFDASMPGTLPVLNKACVSAAISTGLALNCTISSKCHFDRKHYFYADMPQGYQITQKRSPIAVDGYLMYPDIRNNHLKKVGIQQIQLEQDSGKSLHDAENNVSLIDLNRAGMGLMEIVTHPDLRNADDACSFVKELILTLRYLKTCECKAEEGQLRVDANVSVHQCGDTWGERTEVKNINGLKNLHQAIEFEINRHIAILESGKKVARETRTFDEINRCTATLRDKEQNADYRFMPEPNLPPLRIYDDKSIGDLKNDSGILNSDSIHRQLPGLPSTLRPTLLNKFKLKPADSSFLLDREMALYFLEVMSHVEDLDPIFVCNWLKIHLLACLKKHHIQLPNCYVTPKYLSALLILLQTYQISNSNAKKAFEYSALNHVHPLSVIKENDWFSISDEKYIKSLCFRVIEDRKSDIESLQLVFKKKAKKVKSDKVLSAIVTDIMDLSNGKAHPVLVRKIAKSNFDSFIDKL